MILQLITTHKGKTEAVTMQTSVNRLILGSLVSGKDYRSLIVNKGTNGIAPFGVKMIAGREAMIHVNNGRIEVRNANRNIEVVELEE